MKRKTFYYLIAFAFILLPVYFVSKIFLYRTFGIHLPNSSIIQNGIVLFILIYLTINATNKYKRLNFVMFPILFIGLFRIIMHWPFSRLLFFVPAIIILFSLFIDNQEKSAERTPVYAVLLYSSVHILFLFFALEHYPGKGAIKIIEYGLMLFVSIIVLKKIHKIQIKNA